MPVFNNRCELIQQALVDAVDYEYTYLEAISGTDKEAENTSLKKIKEYRKYYKTRFKADLICSYDF